MSKTEFFTTIELLETLRRRENGCSDYRLAKILGLSHQGIHHLLHKGGVMSDDTAIALADELDLPPVLVVFSAIRERSKRPEIRDIIDALPAEIMKAGAAFLLFSLLSLLPILQNLPLAA